MNIYESESINGLYGKLIDCLLYLKDLPQNKIEFKHNNVRIDVYQDSGINDLCDKYEMQLLINELKEDKS